MECRLRSSCHARLRLDRRRRVARVRRSRHLRLQDQRPGRTSAPDRCACQRLVDRGLGAVASRGGRPRSGRRSALPGAVVPCPASHAMGNGADDGLAGADLSLDQALPDVSRARSREPGLTTHRLARVERRTPTATEDLHRIPPSAQRVLRRGLHPQPDAHSQPTLGAHKAPAPDLQDQVRECRLTRSLKSAHWKIPARKPSDLLRTSPWPLHRSTDARALDGFRLLAAQGGCTGSRCGSGIGRIRRDRRWRPVLA
jgi:hypothetical protein